MKEKMQKTLKKLTGKRGLIMTVMSLSVLFVTCMLPVLAAGVGDGVALLLGYVLKIFQYIGALLLVWAIAQLVLAFKNEDADSKSRAMMMLLVAVILCCLKPVVQAVLKAMGLTSINIKDPTGF